MRFEEIREKVDKVIWPRIKQHVKVCKNIDERYVALEIPIAVLRREGVSMRMADKPREVPTHIDTSPEQSALDSFILAKIEDYGTAIFLENFSIGDLRYTRMLQEFREGPAPCAIFTIIELEIRESPYTSQLQPRGKRGQKRKFDSLDSALAIIPISYESVYRDVVSKIADGRSVIHLRTDQEKERWRVKRVEDIKTVCEFWELNIPHNQIVKLGNKKRTEIVEVLVAYSLHISQHTLKRYIGPLRGQLKRENASP